MTSSSKAIDKDCFTTTKYRQYYWLFRQWLWIGYHPKNFPPSSHSRSQSDFPCQVVRFLFFFPLFLWAMISMMPTIMIITPILLRLLVYCIFSFINCSVMNFSNIRGSKYFPVSLHLHDKCRCGPVVRFPVFPLIAIFCPALTCWPFTTLIFDRWRNEHVQMP